MTPSQHLLELNLNLQHRVAQLEQDNQQLQAELVQLRQEHGRLQQSSARYRQLFENAPISMLFINTEGYITQMNQAAEHQFGLSLEQLNKQACPIFANPQLVENGTLPYMLRALAGETVIEEPTYYDTSKDFEGGKFQYGKGHYCPIRDKAGLVREIVEINPDFADLWAAQQRLQEERDRAATERIELLGTIAQVANLLLRSPDYTSVLPDVVRLLGEAVGSDRCCLTQEILDAITGKVAVKFVTEHSSVAISSDLGNPEYQSLGVIDEDPPFELRQMILQGQSANFLVADLPDSLWKAIFEAQKCTSMLIVPIMVQEKCWGQVGFDNCGAPRLFDAAEIAILKIAADSIAAAIERREKDDELRRSEALYRSLFEISNEGIYRWQLAQPVSVELPVDEQVELVYRYHSFAQANDALATMYGLAKAEDIVGMRLAEVHPQDSAITLEMMRAICGNGWQIRNAESEEIDANGQRRYYLNSIISFVENGFVSSGWGTQIDITELREAQQALLAAEQARAELLKTMTTIANHLLRSTDYTLILLDVLQLLGEAARADRCSLAQNITDPASAKSAVRMNAEWCRPGIQASIAHTPALESALLWEDFAELYERLVQGETVQFFGTDLCASLRELFEAQGNTAMLMVPIVVQGEFWGVFGFDYCGEVRRFEESDQSIFAIAVDSIAAAIERQQQDEALRESEKRYRTLFELSNEGIYRYEFERPIPLTLPIEEQIELTYRYFCVVEANTAFARMYGFVKPEDVVGLRLTDIYVENSKQNLTFLHTYIESVHCARNLETEEIDAQSQKHYFLNNASGIVKDGCAIGGWGTQTDITELKQAQEALLQAEQARAAELAKANTALKNNLDRLAAEPELDAFLGHVILGIKQQLNAQLAYLFLYEPTSHTLNLYLGSEADWVLPKHELRDIDPFLAPIPADITRAWEILVQEKQPLEFGIWENPHPEHWPEGIKWHRRRGHQNVMCLPLLLGEEGLGFLGLAFTQQSSFTPEEFELAQALAHQATLAIQLTRLAERAKQVAIAREQEKAAQERVAELTKTNDALQRTIARLATNPDLDAYLGHVLIEAAEQVGAYSNALFVYNEASNTLAMQAFVVEGAIVDIKTDPRMEIWRDPFPADITLGWSVIREQGLTIHTDIPTDPNQWQFAVPWHLQMGHASGLCVPLRIGDRAIGFMGLCFCEQAETTEEKVTLARALTAQATLALELTRLADEAKQAAIAKLNEVIAREQEQAAQARATELAKINTALKQTLDALATESDIHQFVGHVLRVVAEQFNAPLTEYWIHPDEQRAYLELSCYQGCILTPDEQPGHPGRFGYAIPPEMIACDHLGVRQRHFVVEDLRTDPIHRAISAQIGIDIGGRYEARGVSKLLNVPLRLGAATIGALIIFVPSDRHFTEQQIELAYALAQQVTLAIQLTRLAEEAKQTAIAREQEKAAQARVAELAKVNDALIQTLNLLAADPDLDQFLGQVLTLVNRQLRVPASTLWQWDATGSACLQMTCLGNQILTELEQWRGFPPKLYYLNENPLMQEVWRTRCPTTTSDLKNPAILYPEHYGWIESLNIKSLLVVPLLQGDTIIGTLNIHQTECDRTRLEDIELAQALAHQVTLAIQLSRLAEQVKQAAVLEERNRLAREIHDTLAQALTGIVVHLESTEYILTSQPETARQRLALARQLARDTLVEARQSVQALRPQALVSEQLHHAIAALIDNLPQNSSPAAEFSLHGSPCSLPSAIETNLLRIAQEALANVVKHAQASRVQVNLRYEAEEICLSVQDNGQGFDLDSITQRATSDSACFGLLIMQERAEMIEGQLTVRSCVGQGTTVRVTIPRCTI